jgi:hypothetical protein
VVGSSIGLELGLSVGKALNASVVVGHIEWEWFGVGLKSDRSGKNVVDILTR